MKSTRAGFTIIETLVVLVVFIALIGLGYINIVGTERRAPITATVDTLVGDMRGQQTKAMTGDSQTGSTSADYGIYFQANSYTLFKGTSYNAGDMANAVTPIPTYVAISTTLPGSSVIFTKGSGDVAGFSSSGNTITVTQTLTGEHKVISINRYGAVTQIQ